MKEGKIVINNKIFWSSYEEPKFEVKYKFNNDLSRQVIDYGVWKPIKIVFLSNIDNDLSNDVDYIFIVSNNVPHIIKLFNCTFNSDFTEISYKNCIVE